MEFPDLSTALGHGFDALIDVRSPAEYAEDHVPGAINLPVLSNEERARVGTIYVRQSPFLARKIGAAMVFRNAADHLAGPLSAMEGGWRPLVYCWRGGQRSGAMTWMLREVGWRADVIAGGYRTYRRLVHAALYDGRVPHRIVLLDGNTGTAKTDMLAQVADLGGQVLDLEGLANHRGSLLGAMPGGQPSQKAFESRLASVLHAADPARPLLLEAESNKVGELLIPPALWAAMKAAPRVRIEAPIAARAAYLARAYADLLDDAPRMSGLLDRLVAHRGAEVVAGWQAALAEGRRVDLCRDLMVEHYDRAYARSRAAHGAGARDAVVALDGLAEGDVAAAAPRVLRAVERALAEG
ncbi:MAG: tRNA 2-selenouridine(34) synthase MnmH [Paracoccaceae bacterium]